MDHNDNSYSSNQSTDDSEQNPAAQLSIKFSRKKTQFQSFWYDIGNFNDPLISEILSRLPVKSIFRFKGVCKHWKTLISHPSFRRFYSAILDSKSPSSLSPFRILYRYIYVLSIKELLDRLQLAIRSPSEFSVLFLSSYEERRFKVLAISDGLIMCHWWSSPSVYFICDPLTRQCITLPKIKSFFFGEGLITRVSQDHVLTGFTAVMLEDQGDPEDYLGLFMFSSETGKWVRQMLPCDTPIEFMKRGTGPITCYGAFHWFVYDHGMVAFDPYKDPKSFRLIPLPSDRDVESESNHDGLYRLCDECQGILRYFEVAHDPTNFYLFTMWAMKDYAKGEWCCEFKVTRSDLHSSNPELRNWLQKGTFLPLAFDPLNPNVVYLRCVELGWIVSYDVENRRVDVACKLTGGVEDLSWRVVIPFELPRWPMLLSNASRSFRV